MVRPVEKKVYKSPAAEIDRNALYYVSDGYDFIYEPRALYTKIEVTIPGHFNCYREDVRVGTRITCRLGKIEDGITEIELQVIDVPTPAQGDVSVAVGASRSFTPCRHDGTLEEKGK